MALAPQLTERLGRFLQSDSACEALRVSPETLEALTQSNALLRVETADRVELYPELQFDGSGSTLAGLPEILQILLPAAADGWTVLYWLTAPLADYAQRTPVELLRAGTASEAAAMLTMAQDDAAAWARIG